MPAPSKTQVNKAGRILRDWARSDLAHAEEPLPDRVKEALNVVRAYRAWHQYPLIKATNGLRSAVMTSRCAVEVSQRLKRIPTIVDKLRREPTMQLGNMQDIAGSRAVLNDLDEVQRVAARLRRNRPVLRMFDYVAVPRPSGYRAVHVVITYPDHDGHDRPVEIQLRTHVQNEWATAVERLSARYGQDLKSGYGPQEVLDWLSAISDAMSLEEKAQAVPKELLDRIVKAKEIALSLL